MNTVTGTGALARLAVRRDRIMLPAWIYVLTASVAATGYSFRTLYKTAAAREAVAAARPTTRPCSPWPGRCTAPRSAP